MIVEIENSSSKLDSEIVLTVKALCKAPLSQIPGHTENPKVWHGKFTPFIWENLATLSKPWETIQVNQVSFLQTIYDWFYDTGHKVTHNGIVQVKVSIEKTYWVSENTNAFKNMQYCSQYRYGIGKVAIQILKKAFSNAGTETAKQCAEFVQALAKNQSFLFHNTKVCNDGIVVCGFFLRTINLLTYSN